MSNNKKDFIFDRDDSDQQILPFDFMEDEKEKKEEPPPANQEVQKEDTEEESTERSSQEENKEEIEKIEEKNESVSEQKTEVEDRQKKELPETVKITPRKPSVPSANKPEKKKKTSPQQISSSINSGQILQEARVRMDLSIDQVVQTTKIKRAFIEALENGDEINLPAQVYIDAYIKKLCKLYEVDYKQVLQKIVKQKTEQVVPGELLHSIEEGKQINFEEEAKVNNFLKIAAIIILALGLTVWLVVEFKSTINKDKNSNTETAVTVSQEREQPTAKITSEDLEIFIAPQRFTMTEMPIPVEKE